MRILLVEDDKAIADEIGRELEAFGHDVTREASARDEIVATHDRYDAIILERRLPEGDGVDLLRRLRASGFASPIIILTAMADVDRRIEGLDAGADDYLVKPIEGAELEARLRAVRRRHGTDTVSSLLRSGTIVIDRFRREAYRGTRRLLLQPREMRLLEELMLGGGGTVTREALLNSVWHLRFDPKTKLIESQISRLRDKLTEDGLADPIQTVRGCGYRLRDDV